MRCAWLLVGVSVLSACSSEEEQPAAPATIAVAQPAPAQEKRLPIVLRWPDLGYPEESTGFGIAMAFGQNKATGDRPALFIGDPFYERDLGAVFVLDTTSRRVIHQLPGTSRGRMFGIGIHTSCDFDGDGQDDIAVAAAMPSVLGWRSADCGRDTQRNELTIYSGVDFSVLTTVVGRQIEALGRSMACLGDLDGDGREELLVGAPTCNGAEYQARAVLLRGGTGEVLWELRGAPKMKSLGKSVAALGDVDGDGSCDAAIGVPELWRPTAADEGGPGSQPQGAHVLVVDGRSGRVLSRIDGGGVMGFGAGLAAVGDLDGDGGADVAVCAVDGPNSGPDHNQPVWLFSGRTGTELARLRLALRDAATVSGFGASIANVGDQDGDGVPELLVGAGRCYNPASDSAYLFSLRNRECLSTYRFEDEGGLLTVTGADLDGDGRFDVATGSLLFEFDFCFPRIEVFSPWNSRHLFELVSSDELAHRFSRPAPSRAREPR